jgi:uncharacterized membrane protein (Fun14 family)
MNIFNYIKKNIKIIITIIVLMIICFIYLKNNQNLLISKNQSRLFADVAATTSGYTCDRFSGICEVDTMAAEHTNKTSCQEECSKSRYK